MTQFSVMKCRALLYSLRFPFFFRFTVYIYFHLLSYNVGQSSVQTSKHCKTALNMSKLFVVTQIKNGVRNSGRDISIHLFVVMSAEDETSPVSNNGCS